jgi:hypothetical protein
MFSVQFPIKQNQTEKNKLKWNINLLQTIPILGEHKMASNKTRLQHTVSNMQVQHHSTILSNMNATTEFLHSVNAWSFTMNSHIYKNKFNSFSQNAQYTHLA